MLIQDFALSGLPVGSKGMDSLQVAPRSDGTSWQFPLLYVRGAQPGPTLVVTAGVHGDEYEGVEAIHHVFERIEPASLRGTLVMIPVCNVPAYEAHQRSSPIDGLNLARVFPGDPAGTITQQIAHWIGERFLRHADFYIDLHSGGVMYQIPTMVGFVYDSDREGDLYKRASAAAFAFGAPVVWEHPPPVPPGRTLSTATALGVPSLYTEALGGGYARSGDVACFAQGVVNVLHHLEMLPGEVEATAPAYHLVGDGNLDQVLNAPASGYFRAYVELLDRVKAGQRIGHITNLHGIHLADITADRAGIVIMLRRLHHVQIGDGVAHVTGEKN